MLCDDLIMFSGQLHHGFLFYDTGKILLRGGRFYRRSNLFAVLKIVSLSERAPAVRDDTSKTHKFISTTLFVIV
jgi:hypothetical protein